MVRERLAGAVARLAEVVRAALGEPGALLGAWDATPLRGGFGALAGVSRPYLLAGTARVGSAEQAWSLVLKVLAPAAGQDDPGYIRYWRREAHLYRSGTLEELSLGLRAPRCFGCDEQRDGTIWLWLEHVREDGERHWPTTRWALAARHLGQLNGAYAGGQALPSAAWLGGRRLRTWLEHHRDLVRRIAAASTDPGLRRWWPQPVVDEILRLWEEREAFCDAIERLPQTFGHGDAIRRNLLARRRAEGVEETVAIDWEYAGHYAIGEEIGQMLSVASAFYDVEPADLPALDGALFAGYLAGLNDAGWHGDPRPARFALTAHAALRNLFNAVGASRPPEARLAAIREDHGRTWAELAERRAEVRPFLIERAHEARALLRSYRE